MKFAQILVWIFLIYFSAISVEKIVHYPVEVKVDNPVPVSKSKINLRNSNKKIYFTTGEKIDSPTLPCLQGSQGTLWSQGR